MRSEAPRTAPVCGAGEVHRNKRLRRTKGQCSQCKAETGNGNKDANNSKTYIPEKRLDIVNGRNRSVERDADAGAQMLPKGGAEGEVPRHGIWRLARKSSQGAGVRVAVGGPYVGTNKKSAGSQG